MSGRIALIVSIWLATTAAANAQSGKSEAGPTPPAPRGPSDPAPAEEEGLNWRGWPFFESTQEGDRREVTILGLYNSVTAPDHRRLRLLPFFDYAWDAKQDRTTWDVLWPLIAHEQQGEATSTAVRPFFWSHDDPQRGEGYNHLFPLWFSSWSKDEATAVGLPGWVWARRGERRMLHLWPLFGHHDLEGGGTRWFSVAHGLWVDTGLPDGSGSFAMLPAGTYASWSPEKALAFSIPLLFGRYREGDASWWIAGPLAAGRHAPNLDQVVSIPYAYTRDAESTRHDVLFPLFTKEERHDGTRSELSLRPFFWYDSTPERTWTLAPPFFHTYASKDHEVVWTLPYAYTRDAEATRHDVLFPLFTKKERHDGTRSELSVRPLFWYDSTPERTYAVSPLFYSRTSEAASRFWSLPYLYNRDAASTRHDVLFPLFTKEDRHDGTRSELSVRPLFWYDSTPERTLTFAPPFFHTYTSADADVVWTIPYSYTRRGSEVRHDVLFPLLTVGGDERADRSFFSFRPLVFYDQTPERTHLLAAPLFYRYASAQASRLWSLPYLYNRDAESTRHDVLFPLFTKEDRHDGTHSELSVRPLFWYDSTPERTWTFAPPFFHTYTSKDHDVVWTIPYAYTRDAEATRHDVLFPLFTKKDRHDGTRSELSVRPLFWYDSTPERTYRVSPLFYSRTSEASSRFWSLPYLYNRDAESTRHDVLFPLFTKEDRHDGTRSELSVRPLFWYDSTPERTWTFAPPFFHTYTSKDHDVVWTIPYAYTRDAEATRHDVLFPLFTKKDRHDGTRSELSVRPLFWYDSAPERTYRVSPLFYSRTSEASSRFWSLPYLYNRDAESTRHDVLFPLFTKEDRHDGTHSELSLRPLFWYDSTPERTWTFAPPFFHTYTSADADVLWTIPYSYTRRGSEERHDVLFPLLTVGGDEEADRSFFSFRPLVFYDQDPERTHLLAAPLFYRYASESVSRFWSLPYLYNRNEESTRHDVLFPLFTKEDRHDGTRSELSVRPLFWYDETPERTYRVSPLFYSYTSEAVSRFWSLPYLYNRDAEGTRHDVLFPLFSAESSADGQSGAVSLRPLFWYDSSPEATWTLAPPLFHTYDSEDLSLVWTIPYAYTRDRETTRHDVLFPLFTAESSHDGSAGSLSLRPLFFYDRSPEATWTLAFPLFHTYDSDDLDLVWTIPYSYTRDRDTTRHDVLFPLLTVAGSDDGERAEVSLRPLFFYDRTPERSYTLAIPLFFSHFSERFSNIVTPLFLQRADAEQRTTYRALLPLYWERQEGDESWRTVLPLFLDIEDGDDRETHLWPLFGYSRTGDYEQYSSLWPLIAFGSGPARGHSRFLPLWYYDREGEDWDLEVLFPLVHVQQRREHLHWSALHSLVRYHGEGADHDLRVLWWLYRHRQDGERYDHLLLPFWWHSAEGEEESLWVLYPLFEYERDAKGGEVDVLGKAFTFGWGEEAAEWRFLYKFLHYKRDKDVGLFQFNPFFSYEWKGEDEALLQILGGAYYRHKKRGEWRSGGLWGLF